MTEDMDGDRIRKAFERQLEPPSEGFGSRMRSSVMAPPPARPTKRWPLELAAAVLAIVVVAALSLPHLLVQPPTAPITQPGVVPWADLPAPNVAHAFTKPGVRACKAADLIFDVHAIPSYIGGGPANTSFWEIAVTNAGATQCFVGPTMDVIFTSAQGDLHLTPQNWPGDPVYLTYMAAAVGEIDTFPCALPRVTRMAISPGPGLGSVSLDPGPAGGFGTPCPGRAQSYMVELTHQGSQDGGYAPLTETHIQAPGVAHPGERIRFLVTIDDTPSPRFGIGPGPSPAPLSLSPCPTYHLELEGVEGTFHTYRLNCEQASAIAPFQRETFEMFVDVPANAQPGPATLVWSIDGSPQTWGRVTYYVAIES